MAAEAFDKGREAYKSEDYVEAAEQFEKADDNAPSPAAIELAIRARDKAGELDRAATLLALALKRTPDDANLLKIAGDLQKRTSALFQLTANCDQPCDLTVGGKIAHGPPDTQRLIYVQPGKIAVRAGWADNRSESKTIEGAAGEQGELSFTAPVTPTADSTAKEPTEAKPEVKSEPSDADTGPKKSGGLPRGVFFAGLGLTAVLGGVTIWSGIDTINNPGTERVKNECMGQTDSCPTFQEGLAHQRRTNVLIGVTAGVGVATGLIGVLWTDWGGGEKKEKSARLDQRSVFVAPWAAPSGGGLAAAGRF